jgi:hypothetical protein
MLNTLQLIVENARLARRMGAGTLLLMSIAVSLGARNAVSMAIEQNQLLALVGMFILVGYFLGSILEIVGDVFVSRLVGAVASAYQWPSWRMSRLPSSSRRTLSFLAWIFISPFAIYFFFVRVAIGKDDYRMGLFGKLSPEARAAVSKLKKNDQKGFNIPFGIHAEHAMQAVRSEIDESHRPWIDKLLHGNRDAMTFATSILLIAYVLPISVLSAMTNVDVEGFEFSDYPLVLYFFIVGNYISLFMLLMGTILIYDKKRTIVNVLEVYGSDQVSRKLLDNQTVKKFRHEEVRDAPSRSGRYFQWIILNLFVWGNLINILRWTFMNHDKGSWIWKSTFSDMFLLRPDFPGYKFMTSRSMQLVWNDIFEAIVVTVLVVIVATWFRRRWHLDKVRFRNFGLALFIGYALGGLLYNVIGNALGAREFGAYIFALRTSLQMTCAFLSISALLYLDGRVPDIRWRMIASVFGITLGVTVLFMFLGRIVQPLYWVIQHFSPEGLRFFIKDLFAITGYWFAIASVLFWFHPVRQKESLLLRARLMRYLGMVFLLGILLTTWKIELFDPAYIAGFNIQAERFHIDFGRFILMSIAVVGLWPLATPLIVRARRWLQ